MLEKASLTTLDTIPQKTKIIYCPPTIVGANFPANA
jgi:hypothetical protein